MKKSTHLKRSIKLTFLFLVTFLYAQFLMAQSGAPRATSLSMAYNAAGERIQRKSPPVDHEKHDSLSLITMTSQQKQELSVTDNTSSSFEFSVYPNPTHGMVRITSAGDAQTMDVYVRDLNGNILRQQSAHSNSIEIDLSSLASASYIIEVVSGNSRNTYKLLKH